MVTSPESSVRPVYRKTIRAHDVVVHLSNTCDGYLHISQAREDFFRG